MQSWRPVAPPTRLVRRADRDAELFVTDRVRTRLAILAGRRVMAYYFSITML